MQQFKTTKPVGAHPVYWHSFREVPPTDWQIKIMAEFAETFKGKLPNRLIETPTPTSRPYLLMDGLDNGNHVYTEDEEVPQVTEKDSLMIADGSRSGLAIKGFSGALGSTLLAFRVKEGVDHDYMFHLLSSLYAYLSATTAGSAIPHLDKSLLAKLKLATPVCEEQKAIATILDAVDTAIERTRTAIDKAKRLKKGLTQELIPSGRFPKSWRAFPLREIAEVGSGVTLGKNLEGSSTIQFPYLRVENVQDGFLDLTTIKQVKVRTNEVERYLLQVGDVLMTEGGDFDKLGRGCVWRGEIAPCLHQNHIFRVRPNTTILDSDYLEAVICSS